MILKNGDKMGKTLLSINLDMVWLQMILLFIGIIFIIIALFKPKEKLVDIEIEKILEDFTTQINLENEDIIKRLNKSENKFSLKLSEKINQLEKRIEHLEQGNQLQNNQNSTERVFNKYEQVLEMHQAGEGIENIAKQTQLGYAEIKLIIELSKKGLKYV